MNGKKDLEGILDFNRLHIVCFDYIFSVLLFTETYRVSSAFGSSLSRRHSSVCFTEVDRTFKIHSHVFYTIQVQ